MAWRRRNAALMFAPLALAASIAGCPPAKQGGSSKSTAHTGSSIGPETVARVGGRRIEARHLAERINEFTPQLRARYKRSPSSLRALLAQLIEEQLIVAEAKRRGLDKDPRLRRIMRQHLVRMVKEDLLRSVKLDAVSDVEARAYHSKHPSEFRRPARWHIGHILLPTRAAASRIGRKLAKADARAFAAAARASSKDAATRSSGGDLGWLTRPTALAPAPLFAALRGVEAGKVIGPIKTARGFHVVRLYERQAAGVWPIEKVALQAKLGAFRLKRRAARRAFLKKLLGDTQVARFPDRLHKVVGHIGN